MNDASHITPGSIGAHVNKLQLALLVIDGLSVGLAEREAKRYGTYTAAAVLSYKSRRNIVNKSYQSSPDDIVGRMTIASLDRELQRREILNYSGTDHYCGNQFNQLNSKGGNFQSASFVRAQNVRIGAQNPQMLAANTSGVGIPTAPNAVAVAMLRVPHATIAVGKAISTLARLIAFDRHPVIPVPPNLGREWDALWKNFGMPVFPMNHPINGQVKSLQEYLAAIDTVLQSMLVGLGNASAILKAPLSVAYPEAFAFTLSGTRAPADPQGWPDGIYINNPNFLTNKGGKVGPKKQIEVVIHEFAHFANNQLIQDPITGVLTSAYGYSNYVIHCGFNQEGPFEETD